MVIIAAFKSGYYDLFCRAFFCPLNILAEYEGVLLFVNPSNWQTMAAPRDKSLSFLVSNLQFNILEGIPVS